MNMKSETETWYDIFVFNNMSFQYRAVAVV